MLNSNEIENPYYMNIGGFYKITYPLFDDYNEGLTPEVDDIEVVNKNQLGLIVRSIESNYTYQVKFSDLMNCEIREINQ